VTGASGVGKSTTLAALAGAFAGQSVSCVEFDSVGVPAGADTAWRHRVLEHWVQRALAEQRAGRHLVLCGQVPVGELLAAPSADALDGIAACLLHCSPDVRRERLVARGEDPDGLHDHLAFGIGSTATHSTPRTCRTSSASQARWACDGSVGRTGRRATRDGRSRSSTPTR
jgi:hypothetical protein